MTRSRVGVLGVAGLWLLALFIFIVSAPRGAGAARAGQVLSGFCIIMAGTLLLTDWMGTATGMAERSSARWRKRLDIAETRDPRVNLRSTRIVAWWWIAFGVVVVLFAVSSAR
jgi:hypothetical protein